MIPRNYVIGAGVLLAVIAAMMAVTQMYAVLLVPILLPTVAALVALVSIWLIVLRLNAESWIAVAMSLPLVLFLLDRLFAMAANARAFSWFQAINSYVAPLLSLAAAAALWRLASLLKRDS